MLKRGRSQQGICNHKERKERKQETERETENEAVIVQFVTRSDILWSKQG